MAPSTTGAVAPAAPPVDRLASPIPGVASARRDDPDRPMGDPDRPMGDADRPMGETVRPGEVGYAEAADALFAAGSPELIVRPRNAAETGEAVRYATAAGLAISVRSGGHSVAGLSTHTGGVVIDLGLINEIDVVDRATRRVRIGAGATWGEVADALRPHGLGISAGDTREVGVGGLTLGGGIGWLVRRYGLAIDSLQAAEVALADGRTIRVDRTQHAELFWALRGGGGNFGVVTEFEFTAQRVESVYHGTIGFAVDDVARLVSRWRDAMRTADENLSSTLILVPPMYGEPAMAMALNCYLPPAGAAALADAGATRALEPIRQLGEVTLDTTGWTPYSETLETSPPPGMRMVMRSAFIADFSDNAVSAVEQLYRSGSGMISLRALGGAVVRIDPNATAFAHRNAEVMAVAMLPVPPGVAEERRRQQEQALIEAWEPLAACGSGAYGNFLSSATEQDSALVYPEATYRRLVTVKRRYDPSNIFRRNHNVLPDLVTTRNRGMPSDSPDAPDAA